MNDTWYLLAVILQPIMHAHKPSITHFPLTLFSVHSTSPSYHDQPHHLQPYAMSINNAPSEWVTLISSDGFEFNVRRSAACVSGTIRRMLDPQSMFTSTFSFSMMISENKHWYVPGGFSEARNGVCTLENLSGIVLEKVVEYFYYNEKHANETGVPDMDIPSDLCLELLMAADYLDTWDIGSIPRTDNRGLNPPEKNTRVVLCTRSNFCGGRREHKPKARQVSSIVGLVHARMRRFISERRCKLQWSGQRVNHCEHVYALNTLPMPMPTKHQPFASLLQTH